MVNLMATTPRESVGFARKLLSDTTVESMAVFAAEIAISLNDKKLYELLKGWGD